MDSTRRSSEDDAETLADCVPCQGTNYVIIFRGTHERPLEGTIFIIGSKSLLTLGLIGYLAVRSFIVLCGLLNTRIPISQHSRGTIFNLDNGIDSPKADNSR